MVDVLAGIAIFMIGTMTGVAIMSLMVAAKNNDIEHDNPESASDGVLFDYKNPGKEETEKWLQS